MSFEQWKKEITTIPVGFEAWKESLPKEPKSGFGEQLLKGLPSGVLRMFEGAIGTVQAYSPLFGERGVLKPLGVDITPKLEEAAGNIQQFREKLFPMPKGGWGWAGRVTGEAIPFLATSIATAGATGSMAGPFLTAFVVEGGSAYNEAKQRGTSENKAQLEGALTGTINGALELWGVSRILKFSDVGKGSMRALVKNVRNKLWKQAGKEVTKISGTMLKSAVVEGLEEMSQEGVSLLVPATISKSFPKNPDGTVNWDTVLTRIGTAGLGGAIAGGFLAGGMTALEGGKQVTAPTKKEVSKYKQAVMGSNLKTARKKQILRDLDSLTQEKVQEEVVGTPVQEEIDEDIVYRAGDLKGDLLHFGTKNAATKAAGKREIKPYKLNVKNPAKMIDSGRSHDIKPSALIEDIIAGDNDKLSEQLIPVIKNIEKKQGKAAAFDAIKQALKNHGYDGIEYTNVNEDVGSTSTVALDSSQVTETQQVPKPVTEYNTVVEELNTALDKIEELRPEEEAAIRAERGKRFGEYKNILSQVDNPIAASYIARSALAGELKVEIDPLNAVFDTDKIEVLFNKVRNSGATEGEMLAMFKGLQKLFYDGKIPAKHEVSALELIFPKETVQKLMSARKRLGKDQFSVFAEALNVPRSILASYDVSAPLRQGLLLLFRNPKLWAKSVYQGYRAFGNEDYAKFMDLQIRSNPRFKQLKKSGLILTRIGSLEAGEEVFRSELADRLPGIGKGIKASERAYVTTLNALRAHNFYAVAEQWEGKGHGAEDYKQLAAYLNHATGRGDIKALKRIMPALSTIFFAPRLQIGRVQVFSDLITKPAVRKMIAADLVKFSGLAIGLLALLSLRRDVDVELNPISTDFGKAKIDNTRIDFLGGYQQLIRYTAQIAMGKAKSTTTGRISDIERGNVLWRFIQSKLSPIAGLSVDAARGETFLGKQLNTEPETVSRELYERLMPLFIQDVIDTSVDRGWDKTTGLASLAALHGVNVMTYQPSAGSEVARLKNFYAQEMLNKQWDDLSPNIQKMLKEYRPQITLMERQAKVERESTSFLANMIRAQDKAAKRVVKSLPRNVQKEMERLQVRIPGLSRRIGTNWYLNNKRYKEYEKDTAKTLNKILPKIMTSSMWNKMPDEVRFQVITRIVEKVKKAARDKIVHNATINDLEELS
jgi:hypothetical protein